ncbi:hypothetical protein GGS26DRAFT_593051 [Hypomontagnella submonticulosa]|nr:hypothetical protein GGS26DRAFT_593051 [Hypomontagnella submonticulosa]
MGLSSFALFKELPTEVRLLIWEAALPDDTAGICVAKLKGGPHSFLGNLGDEEIAQGSSEGETGTGASDSKLENILEPLVVNCKLSPLFHVCSDSRYIARKGVSHRESSIGACFGAFRKYNPKKDILLFTRNVFDKANRLLLNVNVKHLAFAHETNNDVEHLLSELSPFDFLFVNGLHSVTIVDTSGIDLECELSSRRFRLERGNLYHRYLGTKEIQDRRQIYERAFRTAAYSSPMLNQFNFKNLHRCGSEPDYRVEKLKELMKDRYPAPPQLAPTMSYD